MTNIKLVPLIMAIIFTVTIANLFYHPWLVTDWKKRSAAAAPLDKRQWFLKMLIDPVSATQCPLRGFKCASPEDCDCSKLCGATYVPFQVEDSDNIVVMDKKIEPGTYCLPKGVEECNQTTSISIYSMSGWLCVPRNEAIYRGGKHVACKSDSAENNDANVLWDYLLNRPVDTENDLIQDYYELLPQPNGVEQFDSMRYRCACGSKDKHGNRMVNTLPFVCSVDYCMSQLPNRPILGWNGKSCECGPYPHADPLDLKSPCVFERTRIENNVLYGRVECTTNDAFELKAWYCPPGRQGLVTFETTVANVAPKNPNDFVKLCLQERPQVI